jgi:phage/plasmid-associated DNA primase
MIEGCVKWHTDGFTVPQNVLDDSDEYLQDQDEMGEWIKECCRIVTRGGGDKRQDLFESYNSWRQERSEKPTSYKEFGANLKDHHGFEIVHQNYGGQVVGLVLTDFARAALLRRREAKKEAAESAASA